jgi:homoserine kinase
VRISGEGAEQLPRDATNRLVQAAHLAAQNAGRAPADLRAEIEVHSSIPLRRGLGSSAAAALAGALLADRLLPGAVGEARVLATAVALEGHPDNVVSCLLGGVQVSVVEDGRVLHCDVPIAVPLQAVLFVPDFAMSTSDARRVLPRAVGLPDAVFNLGRSALLVAALAGGRPELLRTATDDRLHQQARAAIFPAMPHLFAAALEGGALASCLSGAGSTVLALATDHVERIESSLERAACVHGVGGTVRVLPIRARGAELIER